MSCYHSIVLKGPEAVFETGAVTLVVTSRAQLFHFSSRILRASQRSELSNSDFFESRAAHAEPRRYRRFFPVDLPSFVDPFKLRPNV